MAAAIQTRHGVCTLSPPARHCTLIHAEAVAHGRMKPGPQEMRCQGFVTSTGRFVDRIEAAAIAIAAGQIEALKWPPLLYSEDLF